MATTLVAGTGAGVEDGLPGCTGGGTSGFESGCEWKRGGGADGVDEGVSVLRGEKGEVVMPLLLLYIFIPLFHALYE